jgi:hypothetical protein
MPENWQARVVAALQDVPDLVLVDAEFEAIDSTAVDLVIDLHGAPPMQTGAPVLVVRDEDGLGPESLGAAAISKGQCSVVVRVILVKPDNSCSMLEEGALGLVPWSWRLSHRLLLDSITDWPARALTKLKPLGPGCAKAGPEHVTAAAQPPGAWHLRRAEFRNLAREITRGILDEQWAIGVIDAPAHELLHAFSHDRVRWLEPMPGAFLADPMALASNEEAESALTMLAEAYWFGERRGKIAVVRMSRYPSAATLFSSIVLERPWHLSYPFLFRRGDHIYCLPEMGDAGRVQLFRADPFPERWVEGPILLERFPGIDPTLYHDGEWFWLFCTRSDDAPNAKLFLFYSDELETGWRPHPRNPVRHDLRNSRPAGPLFYHNGCLWRPAQDCGTTYGGAIVLNRILELTPTRFYEEPTLRLAPDPNGPFPDGLHTFCAAGSVTIIDGKRHFLSLSRLIARVGLAWRRRRRGRS